MILNYPPTGGNPIFGTGADGDAVIAANTSWNAPTVDSGIIEKNFRSLTINSGVTVSAGNRNAGMVIRCTGDCTIAGALVNRRACRTLTDAQERVIRSFYPETMREGRAGNGGDGGAGGTGNRRNVDAAGGDSGAGMRGRYYGGGWSGAGGGGGSVTGNVARHGGKGGGADTITTQASPLFDHGDPGRYGGGGDGGNAKHEGIYAGAGYGGASAGASGASGNAEESIGAGGGAGNIGGGVIMLFVRGTLTVSGTVNCAGANGGNGGEGDTEDGRRAGGGGGAGGSGGGRIYIVHGGSYSAGTMNVSGGIGGTGGSAASVAAGDGADGLDGAEGTIDVLTLTEYMGG